MTRYGHAKYRLSGPAADQFHFSIMLAGDAPGKGQSKAGALLLALAHEGVEEAVANIVRDSEAAIDDGDAHALAIGSQCDFDLTDRSRIRHGLAGVEQQVNVMSAAALAAATP